MTIVKRKKVINAMKKNAAAIFGFFRAYPLNGLFPMLVHRKDVRIKAYL